MIGASQYLFLILRCVVVVSVDSHKVLHLLPRGFESHHRNYAEVAQLVEQRIKRFQYYGN